MHPHSTAYTFSFMSALLYSSSRSSTTKTSFFFISPFSRAPLLSVLCREYANFKYILIPTSHIVYPFHIIPIQFNIYVYLMQRINIEFFLVFFFVVCSVFGANGKWMDDPDERARAEGARTNCSREAALVRLTQSNEKVEHLANESSM